MFDIETIGDVTDQNRQSVKSLIHEPDKTPEDYAALCPPLARVVCIGWVEVTSGRRGVLYDATLEPKGAPPLLENEALWEAMDGEEKLLRRFARLVEDVDNRGGRLITFNGRGYDLPVLVHRAVHHGIVEGTALLRRGVTENRFASNWHLDLMEAFTFHGATRRFPLAAYAVGYGLPSPKQDLSGAEVGRAVAEGRIREVGKYCLGDVATTEQLYRAWLRSLEGPPESS